MFQAIISTVTTGRVYRKSFPTWDKANAYANQFVEARVASTKYKSSSRYYRVEIEYYHDEEIDSPMLITEKGFKIAA